MVYGHDGTIHCSNQLDIEVDDQGEIVSVWFRCAGLPFKQINVGKSRADEMRRMYSENKIHPITAIEFKD